SWPASISRRECGSCRAACRWRRSAPPWSASPATRGSGGSVAEVIIVPDEQAGGRIAATRIARLVAAKPDTVLGLATGSSPLATRDALAAYRHDWTRLRGFALGEYIGLPDGHPQSDRAVLMRTVVGPLGLDPSLVRVPGDDGGDLGTAGERYEAAIRAAGGIDLQVLGIGRTGHIGFN